MLKVIKFLIIKWKVPGANGLVQHLFSFTPENRNFESTSRMGNGSSAVVLSIEISRTKRTDDIITNSPTYSLTATIYITINIC